MGTIQTQCCTACLDSVAWFHATVLELDAYTLVSLYCIRCLGWDEVLTYHWMCFEPFRAACATVLCCGHCSVPCQASSTRVSLVLIDSVSVCSGAFFVRFCFFAISVLHEQGLTQKQKKQKTNKKQCLRQNGVTIGFWMLAAFCVKHVFFWFSL